MALFPGPWQQSNPFASNAKDQMDSDKMLNDWLNRLQLQQLQTKPVGPAQGAGNHLIEPVASPNAATGSRGDVPVADRLQAAAYTAPMAQQTGSMAPSGSGMISDNYNPQPGKYYSDVTPDNILSLIQDPSQAMGYWAQFHGYNDAYANRLSSVFNINDLLRAMGIGGTQMSGTNELDWQGRLADRLSGRLKDASGGGYDYLNPQSIAASIFNTPRAGLGTGANELATSINNPNLQPEQQITNVAQFVLGSLQGVLTNDQLNAYSQVLDQLATQFMRSYQTTPGGGAADRPTFLEFVRQNGGQYGGLF
jgi:hypothetical protein